VGAFGYRIFEPQAPMYQVFEALKDSGIFLIAAWLLIGSLMYTNALSWFAILVARAVTFPFPIRRSLGISHLNQHPAWPALITFVQLNENAKPLFVGVESADAFADWLIRTISAEVLAPANRASPPPRPGGLSLELFRERLGNALVFGCAV